MVLKGRFELPYFRIAKVKNYFLYRLNVDVVVDDKKDKKDYKR